MVPARLVPQTTRDTTKEVTTMPAMSVSLLLIAVGAILVWGVSVAVEGVAIAAIGWILMVVGALGLLIALLFLMSFSPYARDHTDTPTTHTH
jgi:hypothetical protein